MNNYLIPILLDQHPIRKLFDIFKGKSKEVRLVGGCIRDALMGKEMKNIKDIDVAANIEPDEIVKILDTKKIQHEDFAYKYGSITAFIANKKFQITTLREDINQIGRHTGIIYAKDWKKDAERRDFTINSMYLSSTGELHDFFNGKDDLRNNTLRFIRNIEDSIQEDFLRIFRYYRFLGVFKDPKIIEQYDEVLSKYFEKSFNYVSNNLIRQEILKMFNTSFPINCFFNKDSMKKKYWIDLVTQKFIKSSYDIGLSKCLNRIDLLIN